MDSTLSVAFLKGLLRSGTTYDEPLYAEAIKAGGSYLTKMTGRVWDLVTDDTTATARKFRPDTNRSPHLWIHDAAVISSVTENGVTILPDVNYVASNQWTDDGEWQPIDHLTRYGRYWYTDGPKFTVTVTAKWGWTTMPDGLKFAHAVAAKAYLMERDVAFGLAAITETGAAGQREAKAVADFIKTYRHPRTVRIA